MQVQRVRLWPVTLVRLSLGGCLDAAPFGASDDATTLESSAAPIASNPVTVSASANQSSTTSWTGPHSRVATLWPVDDWATAALMERFYGVRNATEDPGHALAMAPRASSRGPQRRIRLTGQDS